MKKQLLSTALSSLMCLSVHADNLQELDTAEITAAKPAQAAATKPTTQTPAAATMASPAVTSSLPAAPLPLPVVDCDYPIPATTTTIDQSLITAWAKQAALQAFNFSPMSLDTQLEKLKICFTDQGWQGFHDALDKSGNINSIKTQNLTVTSQVDGEVKINPVKENQWKVTLPMQVVYKNDKEKLSQMLAVDLLIGRKISGNLGIMQVIATPRDTASSTTAAATAPEAATPAAAAPETAAPETAAPEAAAPEAAAPEAAAPEAAAPEAAAPETAAPEAPAATSETAE